MMIADELDVPASYSLDDSVPSQGSSAAAS